MFIVPRPSGRVHPDGPHGDRGRVRASGFIQAFSEEQVLDQALALAARIASLSGPIVAAAKQAVLVAGSTTIRVGRTHEKRLDCGPFGLQVYREGLEAFVETRGPV